MLVNNMLSSYLLTNEILKEKEPENPVFYLTKVIKKLDVKNIKISANSEKLNINQQISLKDMSFENIGNTKDSKDYKTVLKDTFDKAFKSVKNKVLSGNVGNTLDKIKSIDEEKIKEKIKKELYENKDKVKDKLKKLLKKD